MSDLLAAGRRMNMPATNPAAHTQPRTAPACRLEHVVFARTPTGGRARVCDKPTFAEAEAFVAAREATSSSELFVRSVRSVDSPKGPRLAAAMSSHWETGSSSSSSPFDPRTVGSGGRRRKPCASLALVELQDYVDARGGQAGTDDRLRIALLQHLQGDVDLVEAMLCAGTWL